ncbi:hypothetical protein F443_05254 [Phytophthora nicotianae P1569]|uniref:Uncharacterized protein n=1 Tax=Phytophthora nicotianae P1569 TaxID=1317065 RepID=V9FJZ3_PHYNI|nr:hypothetical protein F443_05254 [Phytophthora nicotianae P1569]
MDIILSHFGADELRAKCLKAVQEELQQAETQLQPGLEALKRTLTVVRASRSMCKSASLFSSPVVVEHVKRLRGMYREVENLILELDHELGAAEVNDADLLAQHRHQEVDLSQDNEDTESEGMLEVTNAELGEQEMSEMTDAVQTSNQLRENSGTRLSDLQLADDEVSEEQREQSTRNMADECARPKVISLGSSQQDVVVCGESSSEHLDNSRVVVGAVNASEPFDVLPRPTVEQEKPSRSDEKRKENNYRGHSEKVTRKRNSKKRESPNPTSQQEAKRLARGAGSRLRQRIQLLPRGVLHDPLQLALNAAIALKEHDTRTRQGPLMKSFVAAVTEAARILEDNINSRQSKKYLKDMEFIVLIAVGNLDDLLNQDEVAAVWSMVKSLQQLFHAPSVTSKRIEWCCHKLQTYLLKTYEIPVNMEDSVKSQLVDILQIIEQSTGTLCPTMISKNMTLVSDLLEGRSAAWDPRNDPSIGKMLARTQRLCSEQFSSVWDQCFIAICKTCSKMNGSTFMWVADLASEPPQAIPSSWGELKFTDEAIVKNSFAHVTGFEEKARDATDPRKKLMFFTELIDRLQWFMSGVVSEENQSLLPLELLTGINECMSTLVDLCDHGRALTLEGCLHVEELVCIIRQLMYMRGDYAARSTRVPVLLLGLFPPETRPKFVYPASSR